MITYRNIFLKRTYVMLTMLFGVANFQFSIFNFQLGIASAQDTTIDDTANGIIIGGNVYGGGNEGFTSGNTKVTIRDGEIQKVFGGGRMADVGGRAFVNLDGEHATSTGRILIGSVYGGNDISGTVGVDVSLLDTDKDQVPTELTDVLRGTETLTDHPEKNDINNSWSAFVRSSKMTGEETFDHAILVGSVYGGGNGDYTYDSQDDVPEEGKTTHYIYEAGNATPIATKVTNTGEEKQGTIHEETSVIDSEDNQNSPKPGVGKVGEGRKNHWCR